MNRIEIEDKIRNIIVDVLNVNKSLIHNNSNIIKNFEVDSLDILYIIISIEDEFEIEINDDEAEVSTTFELLVNLVEKKVK